MDQLELFPNGDRHVTSRRVTRDGDSNALRNVTGLPDCAEFHKGCRKSADVIDIVDRLALRLWYRRFWPKPQTTCAVPITMPGRKGVA
ncbi:hypothetical protein [Rhizobium binae]|uniref:hypothetical protein n=1 Tax=Rhizobium binae TaxID=1138190 RepID=UPI001C83774B|nr:hypothetical protein [Rhizobium binae]MBX4940976.1 hypothetical protein [Rhizobium binae]MBX4942381.1 hypothetical protein [Rhizobium binae]MBX4982102.1 hypothetical protein [Rhizobium binae]